MHNILLIGGSSSVGKTTAAAGLSKRLGWPCIQLDQYLYEIGDPKLRLFPRSLERWDLPSSELCQRLIAVSEQAMGYVESLILGLCDKGNAGIFEGEAIHPRLAERMMQMKSIASVFIIETDPVRLYETLADRSSRFLNLAEGHRQTVVEMDQLYSIWLQAEAERRHIPWVQSQPWVSLGERILEKCNLKK